MAKKAVSKHGISIRLFCEVYGISETCYRYHARLSDENGRVADWLLRLTQARSNSVLHAAMDANKYFRVEISGLMQR
jgi:hypothetical protein